MTIYFFGLIFAIVFFLFIINLVKNNKLDEKYSILWILFSIIIFVVSLFPGIVTRLANKMNVYYPPTLMFFIGMLIIGAYIVHISVAITKQNKMIVKLTQEFAIFKEKLEKENKNEKY